MTRKQCKCQYVQEQGVIFARWIFFSPTGKNTAAYGKQNTLCVFFISKNAIKAERLSVCILSERKKNDKTGSSGKRCVLLSFLCPEKAVDQVNSAVVNEFLVRRPRWCFVLQPYYPSLLACLGCDLLSHAQHWEAPVLVASFHSAVL